MEDLQLRRRRQHLTKGNKNFPMLMNALTALLAAVFCTLTYHQSFLLADWRVRVHAQLAPRDETTIRMLSQEGLREKIDNDVQALISSLDVFSHHRIYRFLLPGFCTLTQPAFCKTILFDAKMLRAEGCFMTNDLIVSGTISGALYYEITTLNGIRTLTAPLANGHGVRVFPSLPLDRANGCPLSRVLQGKQRLRQA